MVVLVVVVEVVVVLLVVVAVVADEMTLLQLLHWNGSLKAMRERQCSRQEVGPSRNYHFFGQ